MTGFRACAPGPVQLRGMIRSSPPWQIALVTCRPIYAERRIDEPA
jgi:hypothetical protein